MVDQTGIYAATAAAVVNSHSRQAQSRMAGWRESAVVQTVNTAVASLATTNYWSGLLTRFEGYNVFDLLGQQATASFIFSANVSGTYSFSLRDGTGANVVCEHVRSRG